MSSKVLKFHCLELTRDNTPDLAPRPQHGSWTSGVTGGSGLDERSHGGRTAAEPMEPAYRADIASYWWLLGVTSSQ